jgi:hypothetical protein
VKSQFVVKERVQRRLIAPFNEKVLSVQSPNAGHIARPWPLNINQRSQTLYLLNSTILSN